MRVVPAATAHKIHCLPQCCYAAVVEIRPRVDQITQVGNAELAEVAILLGDVVPSRVRLRLVGIDSGIVVESGSAIKYLKGKRL